MVTTGEVTTGEVLSGEVPIREVAAQTGLSVHTLRYWERVGLLDPVSKGADGSRRYCRRDIESVRFLQRLRMTGMPVAEMQRFAQLRRSGVATFPARLQFLLVHRQAVEGRIAGLLADLEAIDLRIDHYREVIGSQP